MQGGKAHLCKGINAHVCRPTILIQPVDVLEIYFQIAFRMGLMIEGGSILGERPLRVRKRGDWVAILSEGCLAIFSDRGDGLALLGDRGMGLCGFNGKL